MGEHYRALLRRMFPVDPLALERALEVLQNFSSRAPEESRDMRGPIFLTPNQARAVLNALINFEASAPPPASAPVAVQHDEEKPTP